MKSDVKGCSTCQAGSESYETFSYAGKRFVQYDYRTVDGRLFSCCAKSLKAARNKRDNWMAQG